MGVVDALAAMTVVGWAAALSAIDVRERRLPNVLTLTGAIAILSAATLWGRGPAALSGALALGGLYLLIHLVAPDGMGGGDVKLAAALGALTGALGVPAWILAALGAPILTALAGGVAAMRGRGRTVPHGPSMCAASLLAAALVVL